MRERYAAGGISSPARGILDLFLPPLFRVRVPAAQQKQSSMPERKERAAMIQTVIYVINMLRILYAEGDESEE